MLVRRKRDQNGSNRFEPSRTAHPRNTVSAGRGAECRAECGGNFENIESARLVARQSAPERSDDRSTDVADASLDVGVNVGQGTSTCSRSTSREAEKEYVVAGAGTVLAREKNTFDQAPGGSN